MWFYCEQLTEENLTRYDDNRTLYEWSKAMMAVLPFHMKIAVRTWYMAVCQAMTNARTPFDNYRGLLKSQIFQTMTDRRLKPAIAEMYNHFLRLPANDALD